MPVYLIRMDGFLIRMDDFLIRMEFVITLLIGSFLCYTYEHQVSRVICAKDSLSNMIVHETDESKSERKWLAVHILTGILVSALLSGKKGRKSRGYQVGAAEKQLRVSHALPGRIRLYHDTFAHPQAGRALTGRLQQVQGIREVTVNPVTGSLLIAYDHRVMKEELLTAAVYQLLGYGDSSASAGPSSLHKEVRLMHQAANHALMQKTGGVLDVHTLLAGGFAAVALKEYWKTRTLGTPAPITLLYWAYRMLGLHR